MSAGIIGKKIGMTRIFEESGAAVAVTVIEAGPCPVVQKKTVAKDGYNAVQVGFGSKKRPNLPMKGHFKKAGVAPTAVLHEFRTDEDYSVGEELNVGTLFRAGDLVDVTGITKGRGFQGVVKRWKFAGGKKTHGGEKDLRRPGSIGASAWPSRVMPGTRMSGHMGHTQVTVQNLLVIQADSERRLLVVKGAVPGQTEGEPLIRRTCRHERRTMAELEIRDLSGNVVGKIAVPEPMVHGEIHEAVLHQTVVAHLANCRQGTSSTKTRAEVSGSGRKLFRQKGLGRARMGDLRSPTRVHGGVAHGPVPRSYRQRTPKKVRRLALLSALRSRFQSGGIHVVETFGLEDGTPKTKRIARLLNTLGLEGKKTLLVLPEHDPIVYRSARNIPGVTVSTSALLHAYDVMLHQAIVFLPAALDALRLRLGIVAEEGEGS